MDLFFRLFLIKFCLLRVSVLSFLTSEYYSLISGVWFRNFPAPLYPENDWNLNHCNPGGILPYLGYIGMCGPKGYGFSAVLVINRVSIIAILPSLWS